MNQLVFALLVLQRAPVCGGIPFVFLANEQETFPWLCHTTALVCHGTKDKIDASSNAKQHGGIGVGW
jgi:hypothetical protein